MVDTPSTSGARTEVEPANEAQRRAGPAARSQLRRRIRDILAPAALLIGLFVLWELLVIWLGIRSFILPRPSEILYTIWADWSLFRGHLIFTLQNVLLGFALAFVVAMVLGFVVAHSTIMNRTIYPLLV